MYPLGPAGNIMLLIFFGVVFLGAIFWTVTRPKEAFYLWGILLATIGTFFGLILLTPWIFSMFPTGIPSEIGGLLGVGVIFGGTFCVFRIACWVGALLFPEQASKFDK